MWSLTRCSSVPTRVRSVQPDASLLLHREQRWGLNTYLYAPKDDCKHRMYWRELYTAEEAGGSQQSPHTPSCSRAGRHRSEVSASGPELTC